MKGKGAKASALKTSLEICLDLCERMRGSRAGEVGVLGWGRRRRPWRSLGPEQGHWDASLSLRWV